MSIYGEYEPTLSLILQEMMKRIEQLNVNYEKETGQRLFEHLNGRIKTEKSMTEKCQRKGLPLTAFIGLMNRTMIKNQVLASAYPWPKT